MSGLKKPVCVLFVDVAGSTKLYRRLGDEHAERLVGACLARAVDASRRHGGTLVKTIGDAAMCVFDGAESAAQACVDIQLEAKEPLPGEEERLQLRAGFAAGDAVERDGDYFGDVVNIAARLSDMAKAGQILTTQESAAALSADLKNRMRMFDKTPVKGIAESLNVVQLVWDRRTHTEIMSTDSILGALKLVLSHAGNETVLTPTDLPFLIGREGDCDLVVAAPFSSRHHLHIEYRRGKFVLVDESTNGTYVAYGEGGKELAFVRNEPFTLFSSGKFWLGGAPDGDTAPIGFQTE